MGGGNRSLFICMMDETAPSRVIHIPIPVTHCAARMHKKVLMLRGRRGAR